MTTVPINVLLVGDVARLEFRDAVRELRRLALVVGAESWDAAERILSGGEFVPDLIVVAQAFPGQYAAEDIDRLRRRAPLARVIGLLGSWCEGEMRSGKPWPAAIRVYWHQWPIRCRRELRRFGTGPGSSWTLPVTASDEEQFLAVADQPSGRRQGVIVICARQFEMQDWLSAACRRRGYAATGFRPDRLARIERARAAIFDFAGSIDGEWNNLESLLKIVRPAPVAALLDFPRLEDRNRLLAAGVAAVLSKPVLAADLYEQLDDLLGKPEPQEKSDW